MSGRPSLGSGLKTLELAPPLGNLTVKNGCHIIDTYVRARSCCNSYFNFAICSMMVLPSFRFSSSSHAATARWTSSMAPVLWSQYRNFSFFQAYGLLKDARVSRASGLGRRCRRKRSCRLSSTELGIFSMSIVHLKWHLFLHLRTLGSLSILAILASSFIEVVISEWFVDNDEGQIWDFSRENLSISIKRLRANR